MASSVEPLALGRVIGDVIDMFVSLVGMYVYYGSRRVSNGCNINPSAAVNPPNIQITGDPDDFYTLVRSYITGCRTLNFATLSPFQY